MTPLLPPLFTLLLTAALNQYDTKPADHPKYSVTIAIVITALKIQDQASQKDKMNMPVQLF